MDYYHQHQALLLELLAMIDEYKDLILEHHETVRKRNAWVNIYNPGSKFDSFLKKQTKEMTKLMKKLGVI